MAEKSIKYTSLTFQNFFQFAQYLICSRVLVFIVLTNMIGSPGAFKPTVGASSVLGTTRPSRYRETEKITFSAVFHVGLTVYRSIMCLQRTIHSRPGGNLHMVATGQGKVREKKNSSRSGKSQGISL